MLVYSNTPFCMLKTCCLSIFFKAYCFIRYLCTKDNTIMDQRIIRICVFMLFLLSGKANMFAQIQLKSEYITPSVYKMVIKSVVKETCRPLKAQQNFLCLYGRMKTGD